MELNHLPVIDWDLGTRLAGNKMELAEEMLNFFIKRIDKDVEAIHELYKEENFLTLLQQVHKLHGALCYCGLPRLKAIVSRLETDLKSNIMSSLPSLLNQLDIEVTLLLEHYSHLSIPCSSKDKND